MQSFFDWIAPLEAVRQLELLEWALERQRLAATNPVASKTMRAFHTHCAREVKDQIELLRQAL